MHNGAIFGYVKIDISRKGSAWNIVRQPQRTLSPMVQISVVAPVYNEQASTLNELVRRVARAAGSITEDYEIILVDDGSRLKTWYAVAALARVSPRVKGVRFSRNFGQHPAISAGLDYARGEWVVVMDSDLQDRPEVIPQLYAKAQEGYDVVFVNRLRRPESALYLWISGLFYKILNFLADSAYNRMQSNFSIISKDVLRAFRRVPDRDKFYGGTIRWLGYQIGAIDAEHGVRYSGRTAYNFLGRLRFARRIIVGHSTRLLYVAPVIGALMALTGLVMSIIIIAAKLSSPDAPPPGWASVMTAVFLAGGVTNIMLGLIGLYLAELFDWSKGRPRYVVSQIAGMTVDFPAGNTRHTDRTASEATTGETVVTAASVGLESGGAAEASDQSASGW